MTRIDMNATLAELVTANPALAAHLDRAGLDDCCGGQHHVLNTALVEIEADTHLHVHENNVLFPAVLAAEAALDVVQS